MSSVTSAILGSTGRLMGWMAQQLHQVQQIRLADIHERVEGPEGRHHFLMRWRGQAPW